MRPIASRFPAASKPKRAILIALLLLCDAPSAVATTRPRYGGTLRIEMRAQINALDPREIPNDSVAAASAEKLVSLAFERLVRLDNAGRPQPQLALSWQTDAVKRRWTFRLRPNVKFHGGSLLTPAAVAAALQRQWGSEFRVGVSNDLLVVESKHPSPDLLERLASGRSYIFTILRDGTISGTGPFRIASWPPGQRAVFTANEDHWGGRPFLGAIEVQMGVSLGQQLVDFALGKADLIELAPDQLRRAAQDGARIWTTSPIELLAIVSPGEARAAPDARVLQALAQAVDRTAILNVLLQKQGEVAGGLLPQWLSGYAVLFAAAPDVERARQLLTEVRPAPLVLEYDATDSVARSVAERVALDASQVGLKLQVVGTVPAASAGRRLRLARFRLAFPRPRALLVAVAETLSPGDVSEVRAAFTPEEQYAAEKKLMDSHRVIPLVHMPEICVLNPLLRNWMQTRWGEWRLEDAWLALSEKSVAAGETP